MVTFKQWVFGEGHYAYSSKSDFIWAFREGLIVFVALELFMVFISFVAWIVTMNFTIMVTLGTIVSFVLGFLRFAIEWRYFNP